MIIKYKSKAYVTLVWLSKTWLPVFLLCFTGAGLATGSEYAYIGTFVSGALIPALNLICRNAKQATEDPAWIDPDSENK